MHLVTKSYFEDFVKKFSPPYGDAKNFEAFVNYCAFSKFSADAVEVDSFVYEGADPGIDGAFLFLDDRAVFSLEELNEIFQSPKREYQVSIVLTQAKRSEKWSKKEVNDFSSVIIDYFSDSPSQPHGQYLGEFREMFKSIFENIGKVKNGLPNIFAYFFTAADDTDAVEINGAFNSGKIGLERSGFFKEVQFIKAHRGVIHEMWLSADGPVEAKVKTIGYAPFPATEAIGNSYMAIVNARSFIDKVLKDESGFPRKKLFEENVRDYLGVDAEVNHEIAETLRDPDKKTRFGLMNNGVTIVASSVRPAGQEIYIRDFQIINGCQTSNTLMSLDANVDDAVCIMVKLIEANDSSVIDDIVRATNRQSKVEDAQFISTMNVFRRLEQYFNAKGKGEGNRIYFERRKGQYQSENVALGRIFDAREVARCYAAMIMMKPHLSARYPNKLVGEFMGEVFDDGAKEDDYYVACYVCYRLRILLSNRKIDGKYYKLRWHVMAAAAKYCAEKYSELGCDSRNSALYSMFSSSDGPWFDRLSKLISSALPDADISRDRLKGGAFTETMLLNVKSLLEEEKSIF